MFLVGFDAGSNCVVELTEELQPCLLELLVGSGSIVNGSYVGASLID